MRKEDWEKFFGDVGEEPPLPFNICEILRGSCPFWPGQKVQDTHLLVLIPETVNGKALTLESLEKMIQSPHGGGHTTRYRYFHNHIRLEFGRQRIPRSHWVLMTKDIIPNSQGKAYHEQCDLIEDHAQESNLPYTIPNAIDAAVCILMHYIKTRGRLYPVNPPIFTRCQEMVNRNLWPVSIGKFSSKGLMIHYYAYDQAHPQVGVGCCRKFF